MASHPKHTINGTGTGIPFAKLHQLIKRHESTVDALKLTLTILTADAKQSAHRRQGRTLAGALTQDAARRNGHALPKRVDTSKAGLLARRRHSMTLLDHFDLTEPRPAPDGRIRHVAPLLRTGYLRRKGKGYIRTAKVFHVDPGATT